MLLRKDGAEVIAIPQPSHAWLSGQMMRAWGNERFAAPAPHEEVCLASELHDIGWLSWEKAPVLDSETGLPQQFSRVPPKIHVALWHEGVRHARAFGRYPALLVSLHADTIYARHFDFAKAHPADAEAVRAFLDEQHGFQARMAASLRTEPGVGALAAAENIARNQHLIGALDWLSLEICWGVREEKKIPHVPIAEGNCELSVRPRGGPHDLILDPWPFHQASLAVRAEGKRLSGRFSRQDELLRALDEAEPVLVTATLHKA